MAKETGQDIANFANKIRALKKIDRPETLPDGRIIFAMDATSSRGHTWQMAQSIQADMFNALPAGNTMHVQLVFFRGLNQCQASQWKSNADSIVQLMQGVNVEAGITQIERVFKHVLSEGKNKFVNALVFVGDAFEEDMDCILPLAYLLGEENIPVFMFQEGNDRAVEGIYKELSSVAGGAYGSFEEGASQSLADMLKAVASFAVGGMAGLEQLEDHSGQARLLLEQMKK